MKLFKPLDFPKISVRKGVRKTRLNECAILHRVRDGFQRILHYNLAE